jgi:hypothetical protein
VKTQKKEIAIMVLDISAQERKFLSELLEAKQNSMLHEINHTDTNDFKELLKKDLEVLEALKGKLERLGSVQ